MEEELESGNSLIGSTRGFERNRGSEGDRVLIRGSKRNKYCSIGKITATVLIIVLGSAVAVLCYEHFKNDKNSEELPEPVDNGK